MESHPNDLAAPPVNPEEAVFIFALNVNQDTTREFGLNLINWSKGNIRKPLRVNINSQGGSILDCVFLFETLAHMRTVGHRLAIAIYGRCSSCTGWLVQAADERIIGENSWLLVHEVQSSVTGSISAIRKELARCEQLQKKTFDLLCARSSLTHERIHKEVDGGNDWWIDAQTAKELGLVDRIETAPPFDPPAKAA